MAIYSIFYILDYAIYSLVRYVMRLIVLLANYDFFSEGQINDIAEKVYVVLGVIVLFKIVISCVQYMVNPDTFDDKEKGMGGILKKTVICMGLLVLVRPVFSFALSIQQTVIGTIPGIVMGNAGTNYSVKSGSFRNELDKISDLVAGSTIKTFVSVKTDANGNPKYPDEITTSLDSFGEHVLDGCDEGGLISRYFTTKQCHYDYRWGISTAAGIFLLYILASMSLDIGIRSIKLGILQILAPIPISSYIVSKDKLNKFFKLATKVYLDLFIRLIVVYFIIFFVKEVLNSMGDSVSIANGAYQTQGLESLLLKLLIIIALFMFAKNAPKFICDVLGLDGGGFDDMKGMFTRAGAMAGATGAMLTAGASNFIAADKNKGVGPRLRSAIAGAASAGFRGTRAALTGKNMKEAFRTGHEGARQARLNRILDNEQGVHFQDRMKARFNEFTGKATAGNLAKEKLEALERTEKNIANTKALDVKLLDKYGSRVNVNVGKAQKYVSDVGTDLGHVINEQIARNTTWNAAAHSGLQNLIRSTSDATQKANLRAIQTRMSAGVTTAADIEYLRSNFSGADLDNVLASGASKVDSRLMRLQQAMVSGAAVSYNDIRTIQEMAESDTTGLMSSIAVKLSNSSEPMRQIQKEQFGRIERNEVVGMDGKKNSELTEDPDYQAQQRQNRTDIERDSIYLASPEGGVDGAKTKEELHQKLASDIAGFGTKVTTAIAETREDVYKNAEARAKESLDRRRSNNKQNSGK